MNETAAKELDGLDKHLLNQLQANFPLVLDPYAELAAVLGVEPGEVLDRVSQLRTSGVIRQIGAIFDSRRLGYSSMLVAAKVASDRLDEVAMAVNAYYGVTHNYARNHDYNLWFTITLPPGRSIDRTVSALAQKAGMGSFILLPAIRVFKIGVVLNMTDGEEDPGGGEAPGKTPEGPVAELSAIDIQLVRVLQADLPVEVHPFRRLAAAAGMNETELLAGARRLLQSGVMRRYAAVLRHRQAGYKANAMGAWVVPETRLEVVGNLMAEFAEVSHCYQRPVYPDWPYNLFTMIHGRVRDDCEEVARKISAMTGIAEYRLLYSEKEYKKVRVKYFEEAEGANQEI